MNWPVYGFSHTRENRLNESKYFRIEGKIKNHYVDFPNQTTQQFFSEILNRAAQSYLNKSEEKYKAAMQAKEKYNEKLRERGIDFLTYVIVKRKPDEGNPLFGIQARIYEDKFKDFLEEFPQTSDLSLEEKYQYLMKSRFLTLAIESKSKRTSRKSIENWTEEVKKLAEENIEEITRKIDETNSKVENWEKELQKYWANRNLWKYFDTYPTTLLYVIEMKSILNNIKDTIRKGSVPPCYREMRKLLENLTWAIFDDFLFINSKYYKYLKENPTTDISFPRPFQEVNKRWYNWNRDNLEKSRSFNSRLDELRNKILVHCKKPRLRYDDNYEIGKDEIKVELKKRMSYPLYISLSGTEIEESEKVEDFVHPFKPETLKPLVRFSLKQVLRGLKNGRRTSKLDKEFLNEISELTVSNKNQFIVPTIPPNEYIINFLHNIWHTNFERKLSESYKQYSFFVHSYLHSWQVYPYSSVLEYKILKNEVKTFFSTVANLTESYLENCYRA